MEKFLIIAYKYCPHLPKFQLILDLYELPYEFIEIHDLSGLKNILSKLFDNYLKNFLTLEFKGSIIIYNNQFIYNASSLLIKIHLVKKIKINEKFYNITNKEQWIDNHINEFYWLSVGNNIVDLFKKSFFNSERHQIGNKLLMDKLGVFNEWFQYNQWALGIKFSISDFSLFFFIRGIVEKNNNILNNFYHLHQWYLRMIVKKNPLFFLKNQ
jgi:hypothetical protein